MAMFHGDCLKNSFNYANKNLKIEESKGNNYVFVSVLAIYHQKCIVM